MQSYDFSLWHPRCARKEVRPVQLVEPLRGSTSCAGLQALTQCLRVDRVAGRTCYMVYGKWNGGIAIGGERKV